jgi:hypothetical protein
MNKKLLMRLKTIHLEATILLGYYAVGGEFSVAWCQPLGPMKMGGRKCSRSVTERKILNGAIHRNTGKHLHKQSGGREKVNNAQHRLINEYEEYEKVVARYHVR